MAANKKDIATDRFILPVPNSIHCSFESNSSDDLKQEIQNKNY